MKINIIIFLLILSSQLFSQEKESHLYDPSTDASKDLQSAIMKANQTGKHVLVQVGGNWCSWCIKLDKLFKTNKRIDSILSNDYVLMHLNYSKENKNLKILSTLSNPQRFGFPVLLILDEKGNLLHTQDSGLLETGDHHDPDKVFTFLSKWTKKALDPQQYLEK